MYDDPDPSNPDEQRIMLHSAATKDRLQRELAKLEDQSNLIKQGEDVVSSLEQTKTRYLQVLDTVNERERSILQIESHVKKLVKENETEQSKYQ